MYKFLIVDDNEDSIRIEAWILQSMGHEMDVASDGKDALVLLAEHSYDMMIIDNQMEDMTGLELGQTIQKIHKHQNTPMILATAYHNTLTHQRAASAGFADTFDKSQSTAMAMEMAFKQFIEKYIENPKDSPTQDPPSQAA